MAFHRCAGLVMAFLIFSSIDPAAPAFSAPWSASAPGIVSPSAPQVRRKTRDRMTPQTRLLATPAPSLNATNQAMLQHLLEVSPPRLQNLLAQVEAGEPDDLSLDQIVMELEVVFTLFRESVPDLATTDEDLYRKVLSTRLPGLRLARCRIAPSPVHGFGVFATRDIKAGELVTLYPGDAVLLQSTAIATTLVSGEPCVLFGGHVPAGRQKVSVVEELSGDGYEVRVSDTVSIIGDPALGPDAAYAGHFINDGASLTHLGAISSAEEFRRAYEEESLARSNAAHVTIHQMGGDQFPIHCCSRSVFVTRDGSTEL